MLKVASYIAWLTLTPPTETLSPTGTACPLMEGVIGYEAYLKCSPARLTK